MKILVVNPNTSAIVLDVILASARRCASPGTQIEGLCSPNGTRNIDSAYGDYMSAPHMIEAVRRRVADDRPDAVVLAGFGNVGIYCLDFEGQELWRHELAPLPTRFGWGTAASPALPDARNRPGSVPCPHRAAPCRPR